MAYAKPARLHVGDTVAVLAPSAGASHAFPHIYENGLKVLREWGLVIKEFPSARTPSSELRANPRMRAQDINDAFADPEIKAIFATIGGDDSVRILPFIDQEIVRANPKILMGYSDTTTLHVLMSTLSIVSLYGPSLMAGFSQMESLPESFRSHVHEFLFEPKDSYEYAPYEIYAEGYPEWTERAHTGKTKPHKRNDGWRWIQGGAPARGVLFGGCMEVLQMMKATNMWPSADFWEGKILFLETSENKPSIHHIDHELRNYGAQGVLGKISGLVVARARDFSDEEKAALDKKILSIVSEEYGRTDIPILTNMDFGHTDPQLVLPLGIMAELDPTQNVFCLVETWLS